MEPTTIYYRPLKTDVFNDLVGWQRAAIVEGPQEVEWAWATSLAVSQLAMVMVVPQGMTDLAYFIHPDGSSADARNDAERIIESAETP